jgi:hypothetical protein
MPKRTVTNHQFGRLLHPRHAYIAPAYVGTQSTPGIPFFCRMALMFPEVELNELQDDYVSVLL